MSGFVDVIARINQIAESIPQIELWTHPNNLPWLAAQFEQANGARFSGHVHGIPVRCSQYLIERNIEERWVPMPWGRFAELEASDEHWARPLGLGRVERIDHGPALFQYRRPTPREMREQRIRDDVALSEFLFNGLRVRSHHAADGDIRIVGDT